MAKHWYPLIVPPNARCNSAAHAEPVSGRATGALVNAAVLENRKDVINVMVAKFCMMDSDFRARKVS
jgi:hypothetical protein